jgi:hypothetical protein
MVEIADFVNDIDDQRVKNANKQKLQEFEDDARELIVATCQYYPLYPDATAEDEEEEIKVQTDGVCSRLYKFTVTVFMLLIVYLLIRRCYTRK